MLVGCRLRRSWEAPELWDLVVKTELKKANALFYFQFEISIAGVRMKLGCLPGMLMAGTT